MVLFTQVSVLLLKYRMYFSTSDKAESMIYLSVYSALHCSGLSWIRHACADVMESLMFQPLPQLEAEVEAEVEAQVEAQVWVKTSAEQTNDVHNSTPPGTEG